MDREKTSNELIRYKYKVKAEVGKFLDILKNKIKENGVKYFVETYETTKGDYVSVEVFDFTKHKFWNGGFHIEFVEEVMLRPSISFGEITKAYTLGETELEQKMLLLLSSGDDIDYLKLVESKNHYGINQQVWLNNTLDGNLFGEWFETYDEAFAHAEKINLGGLEIRDGQSIKYQKERK